MNHIKKFNEGFEINKISDIIDSLSNYDTDDFKLYVSELMSNNNISGYQIYIKPTKIPNYMYLFLIISLMVTLPLTQFGREEDVEFPAEVKLKTLSKTKNLFFTDIKSLNSYIETALNSDDYRKIISKIKENIK